MKIRIGIFLILLCQTVLLNAAQYVAGDLAPRGATDGLLNAGDLVVLNRLVNDLETPTATELLVADVAPVGNPDGVLNVADFLVLQRAVMGSVTLSPIVALPTAPILNPVTSSTTQNPFQITGTSQPLTNVDIYVNGVLQQQTTSDSSGNIAIDVFLLDGINDIHAVATDSDGASPLSNTLQVQYDNTINRVQNGTVISANTVWTPGAVSQPYIISTSLTVDPGVTFVIQAGTELQFGAGASLTVNGELRILATNTNQVQLTSLTATKGSWAGVVINAGATSYIDNAIIEWARTGVELKPGSSNNIVSNSVIQNNSNSGVYFNNANGELNANTISNNNYGIYLNSSSPQIRGNTITFNSRGIDIFSASSPTINSGNVITDNQYGLYLTGSAGNNPLPVINGNEIHTNKYGTTGDNIQVGGGYTQGENIVIDATGNWWGSTVISDIANTIVDHSDSNTSFSVYPFINFQGFLDSPNGNPFVISGVYLPVFISTDTTLIAGMPYIASSDVIVRPGVTLTIESGAVLRFANGTDLIVDGTLIVNGTQVSPVIFTSQDGLISESSWSGIVINGASINTLIDWAVIEYANIGVRIKATSNNTSITNSEIKTNYTGIHFDGAGGIASNNNIHDNLSNGINVTNASPEIDFNTINSNSNTYLKGSGIAITSASPLIRGNTITNNYNGLTLSGASNPTINLGNVITNNTMGLNIRGNNGVSPQPIINANEIHTNRYYNISASGYPPTGNSIIDATRNWWNTTIPGEISASIYDSTDTDFVFVYVTIDYKGFLDTANGVPYPVSGVYLPSYITTDTVLVAGTPYLATSDIIVRSGVTLTLEANTEIQFSTGMSLIVDGALQVNGTKENPVMFTSQSAMPAALDWDGIRINSSATNVVIDHAVIEYAENGIYFDEASGTVTNSIISNNKYGAYLYGNSAPIFNSGNTISNNEFGFYLSGTRLVGGDPQPVINANSIHSNSSFNIYTRWFFGGNIIDATGNWWNSTVINDIAITIQDFTSVDNNSSPDAIAPIVDYSGLLDAPGGNPVPNNYLPLVISTDMRLTAGVTYQAAGTVTVKSGATLTIDPGAVLQFAADMNLIIEGGLLVAGTQLNPVVFTSQLDSPSAGDWAGISIEASASNVLIDNAIIQYATYGVYFINGVVSGTVSNSIITDNQYGIYISGNTNPLINSNTIINNAYGITLSYYPFVADPSPTISNNDIYSNTTANLYLINISASTVFNLANNWWGTTVITDIRSTINGSNQTASVLLDSIAIQANQTTIATNVLVDSNYISPGNSPGILDVVNLSAVFGEPVNWSVEVRNSSNATIKILASGVGLLINTSWNGTDSVPNIVLDGNYSFVISVDGIPVRSVNNIIVDNTLPQALFDASLTNAAYEVAPLAVLGTANDVNQLNYTVEVANGFTPIETDYRILSSSTGRVPAGELMSWPFADLGSSLGESSGDKTLRLTVNDKAGNTAQTTVQLSLNHTSITNVSHDTYSINPVNGEQVNVRFDLGSPATVHLRFFPEQDSTNANLIAEISQTFTTAGLKTMSWDGMGTGNVYLPDEAYRFELIAVSGLSTNIFNRTDTLPADYGCGNIGYTMINVRENKYASFNCTMYQPSRISLVNGSRVVLNEAVDVGEHSFVWDLRTIDNKINFNTLSLSLFKVTFLRKDSVIIKGNKPKVSGEAPNIEVIATPHTVVHSFEQVSQIVYQIDQDATVSIRLLKPCLSSDLTCTANHDDSDAITLFDGPLSAMDGAGAPINHSFEWRGYDFNATVVDANNILVDEEGVYTFSIKATNTTTGMSSYYRGSLYLAQ